MKYIWSFLVLISSYYCQGQEIGFPVDASANGFGYATTGRDNVFGLSGNAAALADLQDITISASVQNSFLIEDLFDYSISSVFPLKNAGLGIYLEHFDFEAYRQQVISVGYGLALYRQLSIGVRLRYLNFRIPEESATSSLSGGLFLKYRLNDQILFGMELNPFRGKQISVNQRMTTYQKFGFSYQPSEIITVSGDLIYHSDLLTQISAAIGISYEIIDQLEVQLGYRSNPDFISIGASIGIWDGLNLYISASIHQQLGVTPVSGFGYQAINK
ncbi:MAG: hypothetical protein KJP00_13780 [Bacteroidia bacterium]|nr:hypothetical protein [Bacteroidia bacterium]